MGRFICAGCPAQDFVQNQELRAAGGSRNSFLATARLSWPDSTTSSNSGQPVMDCWAGPGAWVSSCGAATCRACSCGPVVADVGTVHRGYRALSGEVSALLAARFIFQQHRTWLARSWPTCKGGRSRGWAGVATPRRCGASRDPRWPRGCVALSHGGYARRPGPGPALHGLQLLGRAVAGCSLINTFANINARSRQKFREKRPPPVVI